MKQIRHKDAINFLATTRLPPPIPLLTKEGQGVVHRVLCGLIKYFVGENQAGQSQPNVPAVKRA
jgi:hypothetical protein